MGWPVCMAIGYSNCVANIGPYFFFQETPGVLNWAISNNHNNNKPKIREIKKWLGLESYFAQQTPKPN